MELHLFSSPGQDDDLRWVVEAGRPYLTGKPDATVAYLPLASLYVEKWLEPTARSFHGLGRLKLVNTQMMALPEMEAILRRAALAYIPGGNTFLLNHRLHISGLMPYLRQKIKSGLPLVAYSAGTLLCGPNILTSRDLNMVGTPHFDALQLTPFNFHVHYEDDPARDDWLSEFHSFHDNPVIMLEDGAYVKIDGKAATLVRGGAWCWRAGREKEELAPGKPISVQ